MAAAGASFVASVTCLVLSLVTSVIVITILATTPDSTEQQSDQMCILLATSDRPPSCVDLATFLNTVITNEYDRQQAEWLKQGENMYTREKRSRSSEEILSTPKAHVSGTSRPDDTHHNTNGSYTMIRDWHFAKHDHTGGYVKYRDGRLVVPVNGTYLVYSYLDLFQHWNTTANAPVHTQGDAIRHGIHKYNILQDKENILIASKRPHQVSPNGYYNIYGSYLSSTVTLEKGDEIYVTVSDFSYLSKPNLNYFGIKLI